MPYRALMLAGLLLCGAVSSAFLLAREAAAQMLEQAGQGLDEHALKVFLHRNAASTNWPQAFFYVQDRN